MPIYRYTGASALSTFRAEKLLQRLQAVMPTVTQIRGQYVYFCEYTGQLSSTQQTQLTTLLQAETWDAFSFASSDPEYEYEEYVQETLTVAAANNGVVSQQTRITTASTSSPAEGCYILVVPRLGTISPWSSKATDIVHNSGLDNVQRVERGVMYTLIASDEISPTKRQALADVLHDRMTESVLFDPSSADQLFVHPEPATATVINILDHGKAALLAANKELGLALADEEIDYLLMCYKKLERNPTDAELMMFAQINSEHCRHKIFNARWIIDGEVKENSLFGMIRNTYAQHPEGVLSAYKDNGAVLANANASRFWVNPDNHTYSYHLEPAAIVIKVETHNHPTAIAPFAGAATGSGGEIRDEGAVGRGASPKAGLCGFSVSNLELPGWQQPWEVSYGKPSNIASALDIMLEAPIGAAAFNNEFGRPNICGYFRTYQLPMRNPQGAMRGYHKPIMIAGGLGNIRPELVEKRTLPVGAKLIVFGGPAMLIGIGGGAASSMASGSQQEALDFASVQRGNPEMERRCQEVINVCWALGERNPILSIHDVGAGGLSNALPELLDSSERGGELLLRAIPSAESGLSPMEIWCNEAQERYVLGIKAEDLPLFTAIAERERCPFAVVGEAVESNKLEVVDKHFANTPVNLPMPVLFGNAPKLVRDVTRDMVPPTPFDFHAVNITEAAERVLQLPCVADKSFLITIGDRTVTGMVTRDQMVGPWQVPVADVAVTANSYQGYGGEAMAMGERAPIALLYHAASARMAVGEAITNIAAASIEHISDIKLSANWMAAAGYPGEDAGLYAAVEAVGLELCPALGISIPVGKDSLSMRTVWKDEGEKRSVTAPLSLIISAFAAVTDVRKTLTPELRRDVGETDLILIDLGNGNHGLGGSALAQVYQQQGVIPPDVNDPEQLQQFFHAIQALNRDGLICAYHDRSDGGLFATLCEMAFAAHVGITIHLDPLNAHPIDCLFGEELGAVIQVRREDRSKVLACLSAYHLDQCSYVIGALNNTDTLEFYHQKQALLKQPRVYYQQLWSETSYRMQALRDNPDCARQAFAQIADTKDPGLNTKLTFNLEDDVAAPFIKTGARPKVAIVREQGVNGHVELAAVFDRAGFTAVDVHMTEILSGKIKLDEFVGLAAGGGFSYGDVLGAGRGWAQSILNHARACDEFSAFFARNNTFTIGICNGCQMLSQLKSIIPGTEHWPVFLRNQSEQFEARLSLIEIQNSPSIFFQGMAGTRMPVAVAHGEGRASFASAQDQQQAVENQLIAVRYVDNYGNATEQYPANPNGSPLGIGALTSRDGRATIIMPHPERVFRTVQHSWHPRDWQEHAPAMRMFRNARVWVG